MAVSAGSRITPPGFLLDEIQHRRLMAQWMREAHQGHLGNVGVLTLSTGVASTSFIDFRVGPNSFIGLTPTTLNAAGALATTYVSSRSAEGFTLAHSNTATADRAFSYCVLG